MRASLSPLTRSGFAGTFFTPGGEPISEADWSARKNEWLPSEGDLAYVRGLMNPVSEPGKIAGWIAPPQAGIKDKPFEFEYVHRT